MPRAVRITLASLLVVAFAGAGLLWVGGAVPDSALGRLLHRSGSDTLPADEAAQLAHVAIGGPFTLVDQTGRTVTQADYQGRWLLVYFGYTTCPDVCPTTLQMMANALRAAGASAANISPLFITVDPARDTPAVLARYTALFDTRIVGLTGTPAQVASVEKTFRVYAARVDQPGSKTYLMDHTSLIYLMDPAGRLRALFGSDATAESMASRLKAAMA